MISEKCLTDNRVALTTVVQFVVLLSVSILAPFIHSQIITGSIVNALLFISVLTVGLNGALLLCLIPSIFALLAGTLSPAFSPLIPFIIVANILLVVSFSYLKKRNYWVGVISASLLKFLFLLVTSASILKIINPIFSWLQLLTALIGGVLAYFLLKFSKKF